MTQKKSTPRQEGEQNVLVGPRDRKLKKRNGIFLCVAMLSQFIYVTTQAVPSSWNLTQARENVSLSSVRSNASTSEARSQACQPTIVPTSVCRPPEWFRNMV